MKPTTVFFSLFAIAAAAKLPSTGHSTDTATVDVVARHGPSHKGRKHDGHNEVIPTDEEETHDLDARGLKIKPSKVCGVLGCKDKDTDKDKDKDKDKEKQKQQEKQKEQEKQKQEKETEKDKTNPINKINKQDGKHKGQKSDAAALADLDVSVLLAGLVGIGITALL
ncbi:uncharacterized protein P884DRAFT_327143 [Thermothelomyces heterothallicus CBS 202.75]|uniref:uncharacterized protein n=1 Tax=Thermothelomyces heterothallicus CBS 202.75 TaxID=1149848 RepID=UPI003743904E